MASYVNNSLLGIYKIATVTDINAKTVAATTLYTVPTGSSLIVTNIIIRVTAFTSGGKTVHVVVTFGGNSTDFNDFIATGTYTITANNRVILNPEYSGAAEHPLYAAATNFSINITTGSNATTETWTVDVFGYLI